MPAPGFVYIGGVLDPESGGTKVLRMEVRRLHWLRTRAPAWMANSAPLVKLVLAAPALVYDAIRREGQEPETVYVGFPGHRYDNDNRRRPALESEAFCVFHTPGGTVFDWRWVDYERL